MVTLIQLYNKPRLHKRVKTRVNALKKCPQKLGFIKKLIIVKPKKPNSAQRKVARVQLSTRRIISVMIPGLGHNLAPFSQVLVRGGNSPDLPGVNYKMIRGTRDFKSESFSRAKRRSKFGAKLMEQGRNWKRKRKFIKVIKENKVKLDAGKVALNNNLPL
jgi:small subunit ribosomal protein S12